MKGLIRIFLPLCICSFIAFGISTAVLGVNGSYAELSDTSGEGSTTTLEGEFDSIDIDAGACKLVLKPHSESYARVTVDGQNYGRVNARISGGTLEIYNEWNGPFDWIRRLFDGSMFNAFNSTVTVLVPDRIYEDLDVSVGGGSVNLDGVAATIVNLSVGAGDLKYTNPGVKAEYLDIHVSAGSLRAYNAVTENYCINVSAGNAEVYSLTGSGDITVSAGSANVQFAELNGDCNVEVSAGGAVLGIPEDASALIECNKSAGEIKINACGVNKKAEDGETITLNGGRNSVIYADVSAGNIRIVNTTSDNTTAVVTAVGVVEVGEDTPVEVAEVDIYTPATSISAPEFPSAPEAPKAPSAEEVGDIVGAAVERAMTEVSEALGNL